jgi:enoyl-CoA hydratase
MPVTYTLEDHVAVVTLDDGKANALNHDALDALEQALDRAEADPEARAVLLAGRPGRFSAGFDLATMTAGPAEMRALVSAGARFVGRLLVEPLPVVAACTGHALAAGALVLLACDYRIGASGEFKIGLNEAAIGMTLPVWAVELARYRMPPSAVDRIILGEVGGPQDACTDGFLDRVVGPDEVLTETMTLASHLSALRTGVVAGTKKRLRGEVVSRMLDGLDEDLANVDMPAPRT